MAHRIIHQESVKRIGRNTRKIIKCLIEESLFIDPIPMGKFLQEIGVQIDQVLQDSINTVAAQQNEIATLQQAAVTNAPIIAAAQQLNITTNSFGLATTLAGAVGDATDAGQSAGSSAGESAGGSGT
jgi:hypothetical protein